MNAHQRRKQRRAQPLRKAFRKILEKSHQFFGSMIAQPIYKGTVRLRGQTKFFIHIDDVGWFDQPNNPNNPNT